MLLKQPGTIQILNKSKSTWKHKPAYPIDLNSDDTDSSVPNTELVEVTPSNKKRKRPSTGNSSSRKPAKKQRTQKEIEKEIEDYFTEDFEEGREPFSTHSTSSLPNSSSSSAFFRSNGLPTL